MCAWDLREPEEMHRAGGAADLGRGPGGGEGGVEDEEDR